MAINLGTIKRNFIDKEAKANDFRKAGKEGVIILRYIA